jgi:fermentation-respiration switch protein FrsA (DUF1100 family)
VLIGRVWRLSGTLTLAYACLVAITMAFEDRLIFFPTRGGSVSGPGVDLELRAADGVQLHARFIERPGADRTILYLHGNAGNLANRSGLLEVFARFGANVLALDYRGYGQSAGEPSEQGLYLDARAAYDWATARAPGASLVLLGESLGGGPACQLASERDVGGVILLSTFTSIADMAALSFPWLPVRWMVRTRFDNLAKVPRIGAPLLIIHSQRDEVVPFEMGRRLFARAVEPKRAVWLERAGHNDTFYADEEPATLAIAGFLRSLDPPP